jgi:hypothetical protein
MPAVPSIVILLAYTISILGYIATLFATTHLMTWKRLENMEIEYARTNAVFFEGSFSRTIGEIHYLSTCLWVSVLTLLSGMLFSYAFSTLAPSVGVGQAQGAATLLVLYLMLTVLFVRVILYKGNEDFHGWTVHSTKWLLKPPTIEGYEHL